MIHIIIYLRIVKYEQTNESSIREPINWCVNLECNYANIDCIMTQINCIFNKIKSNNFNSMYNNVKCNKLLCLYYNSKIYYNMYHLYFIPTSSKQISKSNIQQNVRNSHIPQTLLIQTMTQNHSKWCFHIKNQLKRDTNTCKYLNIRYLVWNEAITFVHRQTQ